MYSQWSVVLLFADQIARGGPGDADTPRRDALFS
jgi:hypothetical protein